MPDYRLVGACSRMIDWLRAWQLHQLQPDAYQAMADTLPERAEQFLEEVRQPTASVDLVRDRVVREITMSDLSAAEMRMVAAQVLEMLEDYVDLEETCPRIPSAGGDPN